MATSLAPLDARDTLGFFCTLAGESKHMMTQNTALCVMSIFSMSMSGPVVGTVHVDKSYLCLADSSSLRRTATYYYIQHVVNKSQELNMPVFWACSQMA